MGSAISAGGLQSNSNPRRTVDFSKWLQPVPRSAVFQDPDFNIWCGSMVAGDDGRFHLFYSRWPRSDRHLAWVVSSEIAHAVADNPLGPYRHVDVVMPRRGAQFWDGLCTHNPTVHRIGGKFYLYYMGNTGNGVVVMGDLNWTHRNNQRIGVAVADSPDGPWTRFDEPLIDVSPDPDAPDALLTSNPSVAVRADGTVLMVYKAVAQKAPPPFGGPVVHLTATSDSPTGPFTKQLKPIFVKGDAHFAAEDPFVWRDKGGYRAIVKDMGGYFTGQGMSLALFTSPDGFDWKPAAHPLVSTLAIRWDDGTVQSLDRLERPQVWLRNGVPAVLFCAVAENPEKDGSFNIAIPLADPTNPSTA